MTTAELTQYQMEDKLEQLEENQFIRKQTSTSISSPNPSTVRNLGFINIRLSGNSKRMGMMNIYLFYGTSCISFLRCKQLGQGNHGMFQIPCVQQYLSFLLRVQLMAFILLISTQKQLLHYQFLKIMFFYFLNVYLNF